MADKSAIAAVASTASEGISEAHTLLENPDAAGDLFGFELEQLAGLSIAPPKRGAGRPPGSPNRTTLQLQRLLMAKGYRDPAEFLAAIVSMDVKDLAKLGLKAVDALGVQVKAAGELMPYFHSKMPTSIEVGVTNNRPVILLSTEIGVNVGVALERRGAMSVLDVEAQQDQRVSDVEPAGSHDKGSHD